MDLPYIPPKRKDWSPAHEETLRRWIIESLPHNAREALLGLLDTEEADRREELYEEASEAAADCIASVDVDRQRIEEALPEIVTWEWELRRMNALPDGDSKKSQLDYHTRHKPKNMTAEEFKKLIEALIENLPKIEKATEALDQKLAGIVEKMPK